MNGGLSQQLAGHLAPLITVKREGRQLTFRCPHCRRSHWHGAHSSLCGPDCPCPLHASPGTREPCSCPVGSGDGHRVAHCTGDTPFKQTGYVLREVA